MKEKEARSGKRTMLVSVLMSSPGPLVVGMGLMVGRSSTQIADFVRRSAELLALIVAYIVYCRTNHDGVTDLQKKARLERSSNLFVGAVMLFSGFAMLFINLFSESEESGNVIPGLAIALMGVIANSIFWFRYTRLSRQTGNAILTVQARLYRAKALVDICVTAALTSVALFPGAEFSLALDFAGSIVVSLYLARCGVKTIAENRKTVQPSDSMI